MSEADQLLPLSLIDLGRELLELARADMRFEVAARLARELQDELSRLTGQVLPSRVRRRRAAERKPSLRQVRASARLIEAFQAECQALGTTLQRVHELGSVLSSQQLEDLRLGRRTRQILLDAGLSRVDEVAAVTPEQAVEIARLAPTTIAEVRAALMFAVETAGAARQPILQVPDQTSDLFEGLVQGVSALPPNERQTVLLRTGASDRVYGVDEVAQAIGCEPDDVAPLEQHALNLLLAQPASVEACWRLEALCARMGLGWADGRLPTVVAALYPSTPASFTWLVTWMMREKGRMIAEFTGQEFSEPRGIAHFEEMVVATLGRYGRLSGDLLTSHVRAALPAGDRELYPELSVTERVQILGPVVQDDAGTFHLPDTPIPGIDDRHIRALSGLIGVLQKLGSARISSLTVEVNKRLPRHYQVSEQYVRAWLTRHPDLFTQADADRFKLASLDVDILSGLAASWHSGAAVESVAAAAVRPGGVVMERLRERAATEIADLLQREGPLPVARIRSHLYGRFVGLASADSAIAAYPERFVRAADDLISLREETDEPGSVEVDRARAARQKPKRTYFQQRA